MKLKLLVASLQLLIVGSGIGAFLMPLLWIIVILAFGILCKLSDKYELI